MLLAISFVVVFGAIVVLSLYRRRRGVRPAEDDLDAVDDGAVFGRGVGAAHLRKLGVEGEEGPRAREDTEPPRFRL